jgi:exonuclease III
VILKSLEKKEGPFSSGEASSPSVFIMVLPFKFKIICSSLFNLLLPRLAFLILDTGHKGSSIALINAYAPTQDRIGKHPHEVDQFHRDLKQLYLNLSKKHFLVLMSGDLNAKLGLKQDKQESFMGQYGKGTRNHPGNLLANFLLEEDLFAANTAFKKSMRFRSTWSGRCKKDKEPLYNMIDYIMVPAKFKGILCILTDTQCYHGHVASSDHGIVVAKMFKTESYQ